MLQYSDLVRKVLDEGTFKNDRTGVGTYSIFGGQMRFPLDEGFPLLTLKYTSFKNVLTELLWFLHAGTNVKQLHIHNCHIWDEWADENGELGPIYGKQWRQWKIGETDDHQDVCIDQIQEVIRTLRSNPNDRRMIVSAWNVADLPRMKLPPCHVLFQFYTQEMTLSDRVKWLEFNRNHRMYGATSDHEFISRILDEEGVPRRSLSCQIYQRSCDMFLGVPYNIASYATLTHIIASTVGMAVKDLIWTGGDIHLYSNHIPQAREMLSRDPRPLPKLIVTSHEFIDQYVHENFELIGYYHHPAIKAPVAI